MGKNEQTRIEVCADWFGIEQPALMGILYVTPGRGKEIFSFKYNPEWLKGMHARTLDPLLGLYKGQQFAPDTRDNFGIFLDSSPDRWGRLLMQRRENQEAREGKRAPKTLYESDYLLGVFDGNRMGALRFRKDVEGPFLSDDQLQAAPPWTSLRKLENASLQLEKKDSEKNPEYSKWLKMLIAPGASLGGARPKASITDERGQLWIAKFPSAHDEIDIGAWENVVHKLADLSGITVPHASAKCFGSRHHTFLSQRFDRTKNGDRLHFASAMTLLNHTDGDTSKTGAGYLELVEFLIKEGSQVTRDLEQLWRRIVFFICVSNTDDHLRNHGFILQPNGWTLAPAYDMNAVTTGNGLHLNISESDNAQDFELVLSVAKYFRIKKPQAEKIICDIVKKVGNWRTVAKSMGISSVEQDRMANAFRMANKHSAPKPKTS